MLAVRYTGLLVVLFSGAAVVFGVVDPAAGAVCTVAGLAMIFIGRDRA